MKKLFVMAAAVGVALTGCTSDKADVGYTGDAQQKIEFNAPVLKPTTKATMGEIVGNYPQSDNFKVYAVWTAGEFATWGAGTQYMNDVECTFDTNTWTPTPNSYYWPKDGKLTFAAYSPSEMTATHAYGATGLTITDYVVAAQSIANADDTATPAQYDLMFSDRQFNQTSAHHTASGTPYQGVDLKFRHALSSIKFTVATAAEYTGTTVTLKKITLQNIVKKGSFDEGITVETAATTAPAWTPTVSEKQDHVIYWKSAGDALTTAPVALNTIGGLDLILLPQTISSDAKLVVDWTIKTTGDEINQQMTVDLKTILFDAAATWKPEHRYTYNLQFEMDKITFNPIVTPWTDKSADQIIK